MMQIATTNVIKEYFPGRQIGPFGAVCLTLNAAGIAVPHLWKQLMQLLGWQYTLISIGKSLMQLLGWQYKLISTGKSKLNWQPPYLYRQESYN